MWWLARPRCGVRCCPRHQSRGGGCLRLVWRRGIAGCGERAAGVVVETWLGMGSDSRAVNARPENDAAVHDECLCRTLNLEAFRRVQELSITEYRSMHQMMS